MRREKKLLGLIFFLTFLAIFIDLPRNFSLNFSLGSRKFEKKITLPILNFQIGSLKIKKDFSTRFGLDLSGGTHLVLEGDMSTIPSEDRERAFTSAKEVVEKRINLYGLTEPIIQKVKRGDSYRLIVEIPGISQVNEAIDLIGKTAQLSFYEEATSTSLLSTPSSFFDIWSRETALTGKNLKRSFVAFDPRTGKPEVALEFDKEGAKLFEEITKRNVGKTLAIVLDGELLSAPKVNEAIGGGQAVIQGHFSLDEAKRLSIALNAGALPVPLKVIEQRNIGATLGQESIQKSFFAGAIGLSIVAVFMIVNYGVWGLMADLALVIYTLLVLAVFKTIPVTLTLAGIAGFILSIGMAVDANILIFERIKEEIRWGKSSFEALKLGFERAFPSIRDSNVSSLITCGLLYWFGSGLVRGFALTLAIGIVISLFSAITVTRTFLRIIYR